MARGRRRGAPRHRGRRARGGGSAGCGVDGSVTTLALVDRLRAVAPEQRAKILGAIDARRIAALRWAWREFWARPDEREPGATEGKGQLPPEQPWTWHAHIGGRGSGKTEAASRWVNEEAMRLGRGCVFHLVGATIDDARATMIEGDSGLLATAPPWAGIDFRPSVTGGTIRWRSGARGRVFSADRPAKGRGPQCSRMWLDDCAAWGHRGKDALDQLLFGFRRRAPDGSPPRGVISSTPIDTELLRWILSASSPRRSRIVYSRSTTDENRANLSTEFFEQTLAEFEGTEEEQAERFGIVTLSGSRKIFAGIAFDAAPVLALAPERFLAIAIWIDPSVSTSTRACEVGLVVGGLTQAGHVYLLEDLSDQLDANAWPERVLDAADRWSPRCSTLHLGIETNRGGNQAVELLRSAEVIRRLRAGKPGVSVHEIRTVFASVGKGARATPLPRLYAAGRVHHVHGLGALERQLRALDDTVAPHRDRADAAVYCVLDLAGILDVARGGSAYAVGGEPMPSMPFTPIALGSINVGPLASTPRPFQFGVPGGAAPAPWRSP